MSNIEALSRLSPHQYSTFLDAADTCATFFSRHLSTYLSRYRCVDLRTVSYEVPPQEMLSRDSVTVSVDAVCFYKISNPLAAVCNVGNYTHSTNLLVATSLRNVLGTKTLAEILSERETICHVMEHILDEATRPWGVKASDSNLTLFMCTTRLDGKLGYSFSELLK